MVAKKQLMLRIFLHVNRDLTDFQREILTMVLGPLGPEDDGGSGDSLCKAVAKIDHHIQLLSRAGWAPDRKQGDQVLTPAHYDRFPMEPTYFIVESGGYHWCIENFIKYVVRFPFKNGIEDLKKAMRNLAMYIRYLDGDEKWSR